MRNFLSVIAVSSFCLMACERIPEWERRADKTRSLELATRMAELRKWVFTCRGQVPQAEKDSPAMYTRVMDMELEAVQDYFRSKNLSSIDTGDSKTLLGTAFLWDSTGHALLAMRSAIAPKEIECRRMDGEWLKATLIGVDAAIDYGVLQIHGLNLPKQDNPWLGRSKELKEDENYSAVSVPLPGMIQRIPVSLQTVGYHFNSGMDSELRTFLPAVSPLFLGGFITDEHFAVVGFCLPQWSAWTVAIGVDRMRLSVNSIVRGESLKRPFLGLRVSPEQTGFVVQQVEVGGPAYRAGLRSQDILLEWDGKKLAGLSDWHEATGKDIGRVVPVKFKRGASLIESGLKVGAQD